MTTAIVTGGSRGIGLAIATAIARKGGRVMISGRNQAAVDAAVLLVAQQAADTMHVAGCAADVRDRTSVEALVASTVDAFGGFDTLVNNAGVGAFGDVATLSDADWRRVMDTNLTGAFFCSRAAIPWLKAAGGGWIVNIASLAGRGFFAGGAAYCASKAGLIAFSEALMLEVRADGIRVTVVMPGSVATDFNGPMHGSDTDSSWKLSPDDVAQAVVDLLGHPARSLPSKIEIRPAKTR
jgi:NAD(P)-dependent dehydrogenase (short-subunit alcohol dehydrogenase family)